MKALDIMIVDDSPLTSKKLQKIIEDAGHRVVKVCSDGREAVAAFPAIQPDLVTMDISMPEMNGIEATKAILALSPQALIVVVTAQGQEQMVIEAIEAGAKGYLLKPIRSEALCDTLDKVWNRYGR